MGETDTVQVVLGSEVLGEETMRTYLGFWAVTRNSLRSLDLKDGLELIR